MEKIFRIQNKIYSTKLKLIRDKNNLLNKDIIVEFNNELNTKMNLKDAFKLLLFFKPGNAIFFDNKGTIYQKNQKPSNRKFKSQKYKYSKNEFFEDILGYKYIFKPIINFDFYCHIHGEKNIFYCTDCKIHLCNKCIKLYSLSKESKKELLIFFSLKKNMKIISENKLKKINKYINNFKGIDEALNACLKYKNYKHNNNHKIIELNKYKLSDNEIQYYTQNIEKVSKILENSKNSSNYEINMLLLEYCKMYIEFYQSNLKLGLNYNIIYSIRNNIKFNENFLNNNIKEDNNSIILNLSYDDKNEKFFLLKPFETFNLKTFQEILFITVSPDLSEVLLGFENKLKIFNFKPFQLNLCIYISSEKAKYLSNGNLIVLPNFSYSPTIILFKNKNKKGEKIFLNYSKDDFYEYDLIIDIPENRYFSFVINNKYGRYRDKIILIYNYQNQLVQEINTNYEEILNLLYLSKFDCFFCFGYKFYACLSIYRKNNFSYEFVNKFDYIQFFDFMNDRFLINNKSYYDYSKYYNIVCCKNKIIYNNYKYLNELDIEEKEENDIEIMCERKIDNQNLRRYEYLTKRNEIIFWEITNNKDNNDNVLNFYIYSP